MNVRKTFLSALAACFGLALFVASCATPSTTGTTCPAGQMSCGGVCTDVTTTQNCGACGKVCGTGASCQAGACKCGSGLLNCNGSLRHVQQQQLRYLRGHLLGDDGVQQQQRLRHGLRRRQPPCAGGSCPSPASDANCGTCGTMCSGGATCQNGACTCTVAGQMLCSGTCFNTTNDPQHCGSCSTVCASGQTCVNSACTARHGRHDGLGRHDGRGRARRHDRAPAGSTAGTGGSTAGTGGSTRARAGTAAHGHGGTTGPPARRAWAARAPARSCRRRARRPPT